MSIQGQRVVQTNALPPNTVPPLEAGSSNIFESAAMKSTNQNQLQNTLVKQGGRVRKCKMRMRGGANGVSSSAAPVVVVAGAASYDPNPAATNANNMQLAGLANTVSSQAALDQTVGKSQASAAAISAQQQAVYNGKGGSSLKKKKIVSKKKGGSWPVWGCLSGGKKSRRDKKSCKCKRRKSHRYTNRHRY